MANSLLAYHVDVEKLGRGKFQRVAVVLAGEITTRVWNQIRAGALRRDLEFSVTPEYCWEVFLQQRRKCALTGVKLTFPKRTTSVKSSRWKFERTASLDRINSNRGYVPGNVRWTHKRVNVMRSDQTDDEFFMWCNLVVRHTRKLARRKSRPDARPDGSD